MQVGPFASVVDIFQVVHIKFKLSIFKFKLSIFKLKLSIFEEF